MATKCKAKTTNRKLRKRKLRQFNVFYTPFQSEHELLVEAETLGHAVAKVQELMGMSVQSIKGGWEITQK